MIRHIAKIFATIAVALSLLLVLDSIQGLATPGPQIAASVEKTSR